MPVLHPSALNPSFMWITIKRPSVVIYLCQNKISNVFFPPCFCCVNTKQKLGSPLKYTKVAITGLPTKDETVKTTQISKKYEDLKLDF